MKILSAAQTHNIDAATIQHTGISSVDLMERAATAFINEFTATFQRATQPVYIFCGPGNNGGDGLAIARMLLDRQYEAHIFTVNSQEKGSADFNANLKRLQERGQHVQNIEASGTLPMMSQQSVVIDGLFGSGLSRKIEGFFAQIITQINHSKATVVAIDIPSGLYADKLVEEDAPIIQADYTFTFQMPKLAFLLPQNEPFVGEWKVLDIGLYQPAIEAAATDYYYAEPAMVKAMRKKRKLFSNKGNYGKVIMIAGSYGKMGASVICAKACLKSGVGLLTVHVPECGYEIMQIANPEAMTTTDQDHFIFTALAQEGRTALDKYDVVGIGPGIGTDEKTVQALKELLKEAKKRNMRMVLDADALNICSKHPALLENLPENSILTPHPKEFERLTEKASNDFHRLELLQQFTKKHKVYVTLKGSRTAIGTPDGKIYFNSTGNPGMATGGTGDALTGVITALIAQQYGSGEAAMLGVYLHGLAGDLAADALSQEAMTATDLIDHLGKAFKNLA